MGDSPKVASDLESYAADEPQTTVATKEEAPVIEKEKENG